MRLQKNAIAPAIAATAALPRAREASVPPDPQVHSERVLRLPLPSVASRIPGGPTLCGLALVLVLSGVLFAALDRGLRVDRASALSWTHYGGIFIATVVLLYLCCPGEVVIGTDGVLLRELICSPFVRYGTLERIVSEARGVKLELKDGTVLLVRTASPTVLARIQQALALERSMPHPRAAFEQLDRGRRSLAAWREALRKLRVGSCDYRSTTVSAADLGALIEDPTAPIERRVGAAMALGEVDREGARHHACRAANACVDGAWPAALRYAAEGNITLAILRLDSRAALRESRRLPFQAPVPRGPPSCSSRTRLVNPDRVRRVRSGRSTRSARRRRGVGGATASGATREWQMRRPRAPRRGVSVRSCARARRSTPR
jgi:hypothetical protein